MLRPPMQTPLGTGGGAGIYLLKKGHLTGMWTKRWFDLGGPAADVVITAKARGARGKVFARRSEASEVVTHKVRAGPLPNAAPHVLLKRSFPSRG